MLGMEFEIRSLLEEDGQYVPVDSASRIPNKTYVSGAIIWRIGNKAILTERQSDLVDQLWAYIIDGLLQLRMEGAFETYFPDQALLLRFLRVESNQCRITVGDREFSVDCTVMNESLCQGGRLFFSRMCELIPEHDHLWREYLKKIEGLQRQDIL